MEILKRKNGSHFYSLIKKKFLYTQLITFFALCFFHNPSFAINPTEPFFIASGEYRDITNTTESPLLAVSQSNGKSWFFPKITDSQLPSDVENYAILNRVDCNPFFCLALGFYKTSQGTTEFPSLFAVSEDKGTTWSYFTNHPPKIENAYPNDVRCKDNQCVIFGSYWNKTKRKSLPLLGIVGDKGRTWVYPDSIFSNFPNLKKDDFSSNSKTGDFNTKLKTDDYADFRDFTFTSEGGIAIGSHQILGQEDPDASPLMAISVDKGMTWTYLTVPLPTDYAGNADLRGVSCGTAICIATGGYVNKHQEQVPFVIMSKDNGRSWKQANIPGSPAQIDPNYGYNANNVSCQGTSCVIVGNYGDSRDPLVLVTNDNGSSWYYPKSILENLPFKSVSTYLAFINCNGDLCISGGAYHPGVDDIIALPLLAMSHDSGRTWFYRTTAPTEIDDFGRFEGGSCSENACVAVGQYACQDEKICPPLLAASQDKGMTWTFPLSLSLLPSDYERGVLRNAANSNGANHKSKLSRLRKSGRKTKK